MLAFVVAFSHFILISFPWILDFLSNEKFFTSISKWEKTKIFRMKILHFSHNSTHVMHNFLVMYAPMNTIKRG